LALLDVRELDEREEDLLDDPRTLVLVAAKKLVDENKASVFKIICPLPCSHT
jgi:hypothetical protein